MCNRKKTVRGFVRQSHIPTQPSLVVVCKHTPSSGGFLAARARVYSKAEDPNKSLVAANASTKVLQPQVHHLVELGADPHQNVTAIKSQYLLNLQNLQTHKTQADCSQQERATVMYNTTHRALSQIPRVLCCQLAQASATDSPSNPDSSSQASALHLLGECTTGTPDVRSRHSTKLRR